MMLNLEVRGEAEGGKEEIVSFPSVDKNQSYFFILHWQDVLCLQDEGSH